MVSEEMKYIIENKKILEEKYSGKYIAVHQEKVIAAERTIHEVYTIVEELNISNPLVTYVPRKMRHFSYRTLRQFLLLLKSVSN